MYKLSRNYKKLYKLINQGNTVICFVDFSFPGSKGSPSRDICKASKNEDRIYFYSRGCVYIPIESWEPKTYDFFELLCMKYNVEWVKP